MLVQITGTNLYRDTETMAQVNKDDNGLKEYNMKRRMMATQKEEINKVKSEIAGIKEDISEIKQLMLKLMGKGTNG
jgi:chaperonin cofactor prefoldin